MTHYYNYRKIPMNQKSETVLLIARDTSYPVCYFADAVLRGDGHVEQVSRYRYESGYTVTEELAAHIAIDSLAVRLPDGTQRVIDPLTLHLTALL